MFCCIEVYTAVTAFTFVFIIKYPVCLSLNVDLLLTQYFSKFVFGCWTISLFCPLLGHILLILVQINQIYSFIILTWADICLGMGRTKSKILLICLKDVKQKIYRVKSSLDIQKNQRLITLWSRIKTTKKIKANLQIYIHLRNWCLQIKYSGIC